MLFCHACYLIVQNSDSETDEKLRRENIKGKSNANSTHFEVGAKVRQTIEEPGGTMPGSLPTTMKDRIPIYPEISHDFVLHYVYFDAYILVSTCIVKIPVRSNQSRRNSIKYFM